MFSTVPRDLRGRALDALFRPCRPDGAAAIAADCPVGAEHLQRRYRADPCTVENILAKKEQFDKGWIAAPPLLKAQLETLTETIKAKPDQSASGSSADFLICEDRPDGLSPCAACEETGGSCGGGREDRLQTYCDVAEEHLGALYAAVEGDFSAYYRRSMRMTRVILRRNSNLPKAS